jgi:hypothetical protein
MMSSEYQEKADEFKAKMIHYGKTKRFRGPFKEGTIKTYMSNLRLAHAIAVHPGIYAEDGEGFMDWAKDSQAVFKAFKDAKKSPKTLLNYNASIVNALQVLEYPKEVYEPYQLYRETMNSQFTTGGLTDNQKKVMEQVKKEDILGFLNSDLYNDAPYDKMMKLILLIHVHYPFRNELADMKWILRTDYVTLSKKQQEENNWITIGNFNYKTKQHKLSFVKTKYKTSKTYGTRQWNVIPEVADAIYGLNEVDPEFIPNFSENARYQNLILTGQHMFKTKSFLPTTSHNGHDDIPFSRNMLSRHLGEFTKIHLGQPISTTLMAKYFGTKAKDPLNPTPEEIKAIVREADIRGHSIRTKLTIYNV